MEITIDDHIIPITMLNSDDDNTKYNIKIGETADWIEGTSSITEYENNFSLQDLYNLKNDLERIIKHFEMEKDKSNRTNKSK